MSNQTKPEPLRIRLENVRLSFPALDKATSIVTKNADGSVSTSKPKFAATFLLNKKEHATTIKKIEAMIERAQIDKFGKILPPKLLKNVCLRDGEEKEFDGYGPEVMSLNAKNDNRPAVVDGQKNPVTKDDAKWPYAGCYVNATVEIYGYSHPQGGKGVSAQLRAVQFVKDGEAFGAGRVDADEEFDEVPAEVEGL